MTATLVRTAEPSPAAPQRRPRRLTTVLFVVALLVAAYTGVRLPGAWAVTLDAVSVTDGFHRRFLLGTLLHPLAVVTGYDYWLFAAAGFLVLGGLLAVVTVAFFRTRNESRRLLVIAWLLLPTGGFLFHDVGYFEQVLYLLLFASVWLLRRDRTMLAPALVIAAVLVHEIAALTVLPIFALVALQRFPLRRAMLLMAPPVFVELVVLAIPASDPDSIDRLRIALAGADFSPRLDALALFGRTQSESWRLYSITDVLLYVVPIAIVVMVGFLGQNGVRRAAVLQVAAIGAPALLTFGGWDGNRWGFLLVANFAVVLWLWLERRELRVTPFVVTLLLLTRLPLPYFDGYQPRELTVRQVVAFAEHPHLLVVPEK
jgi:hypothetical protein